MQFNFRDKNGNIIVSKSKAINDIQPTDTLNLTVSFNGTQYKFKPPLMTPSTWGQASYPTFIPVYKQVNYASGGSYPALFPPEIVFQKNNKVYVAKYNRGFDAPTVNQPVQTFTLSDGTKINCDSSNTNTVKVSSSDTSLYVWMTSGQYPSQAAWTPLANSLDAVQTAEAIWRQVNIGGGSPNKVAYTLICAIVSDFTSNGVRVPNYIDFTVPEKPTDWTNTVITGDLTAPPLTKTLYVYNDGIPTELPGRAERFINSERVIQGTPIWTYGSAAIERTSQKRFSGQRNSNSFLAVPYTAYKRGIAYQGYNMYMWGGLSSTTAPSIHLSDDRITPLAVFSWNQLTPNQPGRLDYSPDNSVQQSVWRYETKGRITDTVAQKTYNCIPLDCIDPAQRGYLAIGGSLNNWADRFSGAQVTWMLPYMKIVSTNPNAAPADTYKYQYLVLMPPYADISNLFGGDSSQQPGQWGFTFTKQPDLSGWQLNDGTYQVQYAYYTFANTNFDSDISAWDVSKIGGNARQPFKNCPCRAEYKPAAWRNL